MQYSLVDGTNTNEIRKLRDCIDLSLQDGNELPPMFNTINSITVPVNQEIGPEMSRFKEKNKVYKNPNLSEIHTKSAIEAENLKNQKIQRKSRPGRRSNQDGVGYRKII